jgi:hypothetical protein
MNQIKDPTSFYLYVNNSLWTRISSVSSFSNQWAPQYVLAKTSDGNHWEVIFGNDSATSPLGRIPDASDEISVYLLEEDCVIQGLTPPYKLKLDYPSDGVKENTSIRFYGGVFFAPPEVIPGGITRFRLKNKNILVNQVYQGDTILVSIAGRTAAGIFNYRATSSTFIGDTNSPFQNYQNFVDGSSELASNGDWTIDDKEGILYCKTPTTSEIEHTIQYWWQDIMELNSFDWDFAEGKLDEIVIYESGYKTRETELILGTDLGAAANDSSVTVTDLDSNVIKGIVSKSLRIQDGLLGGYKSFEIPFIDGKTEFLGRARIQDETVPNIVSGADSIASFRVTHWQNLIGTSSPFFNDSTPTYFKVEKSNLVSCTVQGDYFFDTTGTIGTLDVHMGGVGVTLPDGYTISYQYRDEFASERMKGSYSVDSTEGIIYFAEPLLSSDITKKVKFKYTPFKARYNISAQLKEGSDYEVDTNNNRITILSGAHGGKEEALSVNYKYKPDDRRTLDLAPYYSPLVRALNIKVS